MQLVLVGTNHRSCPIELRERLAFHREQLPEAYRILRDELGLPEALILSTCNRVEIYAGVPQVNGTVERLSGFLQRHGGFANHDMASRLYARTEPDSIAHLFAVASGLDSMVLGEAEILHQVKQAYDAAKAHGVTGKFLNVLFQKALNAGKAVRATTALGAGGVSIGTVAIGFAQKIFGSLEARSVVLVGAGKIGELTLKRLTDRGVSSIRILNRSPERGQRLAQTYGGQADGLDTLAQHLRQADIVITSAASPQALIRRADLAKLLPIRRQRPLCLIDLGVPRNIEAGAGELENVYVFDIDDLQTLVTHHHQQRQQAVQRSREIVQHKVHHFLAWRQRELNRCAPWSSELAAAP